MTDYERAELADLMLSAAGSLRNGNDSQLWRNKLAQQLEDKALEIIPEN